MKTVCTILLSLPVSVIAQINIMSINREVGSNEQVEIYNTQEITFSDLSGQDVMFVHKKDGTTETIRLSEIFRIIFNGITGTDEVPPAMFALGNYPNPFNQGTSITYVLPVRSKVELTVFDINGRLLYKLVDEVQEPGSHTIAWPRMPAHQVTGGAGIFFYQLKIDDRVLAKRAMRIK